MKSIFSPKGGWVVLLWLASTAHADQWTFFYPEMVTTYGCQVEQVDMRVNGVSRGETLWEARAHADRTDHTHWSQEIGVFPFTIKGRHQAEKACSKWQDEAEKRVRKAQ